MREGEWKEIKIHPDSTFMSDMNRDDEQGCRDEGSRGIQGTVKQWLVVSEKCQVSMTAARLS